MIKLYYSKEDAVKNVDNYFKQILTPDLLNNKINEKIIERIDKCKHIKDFLIESTQLGTIPPDWLSGGSKALIIMNSTDRIVDANNCGENCLRMLQEIADSKPDKNLTISISYPAIFPNYLFPLYSMYSNKELNSELEFILDLDKYENALKE